MQFCVSLSSEPNNFKIDFSFAYTSLLIFHINMDTLTDEILHICTYLADTDNIHFSVTSKRFSVIKFCVLFFAKVRIKDIIHLSYFHQFSDVIMSDTNDPLPKHIIHLTFGEYFNKPINGCIPNSVTHLTFGTYFDQPINSCIPNSVTHLTFGWNFNQQINGCISDSVTNLTFGSCFNQPIKDCIPDSVTHLTFGWNFNQPINNCIPDSVTHLTFGYDFDKDLDELPISINNIELSSNYKRSISEKILPKVTIRK